MKPRRACVELAEVSIFTNRQISVEICSLRSPTTSSYGISTYL